MQRRGGGAVVRLRLAKRDDEAQSLGDPTAGTDYAMCLYGAGASPALDGTAPADGDCTDGTCWTKRETAKRTALLYRGGESLRELRLERKRGGTRIVGRALGPVPDGLVRVQVRNSAGACWAGSATGAFVD